MWACARGKLEAAAALSKWKPACLMTPNREGQYPLHVARMMGHTHLAQSLELLEAERQHQQQLAQKSLSQLQQEQLKELHISTSAVHSSQSHVCI